MTTKASSVGCVASVMVACSRELGVRVLPRRSRAGLNVLHDLPSVGTGIGRAPKSEASSSWDWEALYGAWCPCADFCLLYPSKRKKFGAASV
jgi:hypothetical protein